MKQKTNSHIVKIVMSLWIAIRYVAILFGLIAIGWFVYEFFIRDLIYGSRIEQILAFFLAWLTLAYILIPRIHRILTKLYLPDYFIGRSRTVDGILSDPINLAFIGSENELKAAMQVAGWYQADKLTIKTAIKTILYLVVRKIYINQPVSGLYLFNNKQMIAFQKVVPGSPFVRHHVRFWKTPDDLLLPGYLSVDWLAAGTFDKSVGLSYFTLQITHHIEPETDKERDFIVNDLKKHGHVKNVKIVKNYFSSYRHRNGGGDVISTDGSLPIVKL